MNLTITVCTTDEARSAQAVLQAFIDMQEPAPPPSPPLSPTMSLDDLWLSGRARNRLVEANISTVAQLLMVTANKLLQMPFMGRGTLREIEAALGQHGLTLAAHGTSFLPR